MRKIIAPIFFIVFFCLHSKHGFSQTLRYSVSMPYVSLGAYSTKQSDPFAFTNNQAALAQVKTGSAGVFGERRFMLSENSLYGLAAALPTSLGNFGVQVNYAGFKNFNENKIGLAYARKLGKLLDLGVQFNYYGYRIPQYGNASSVNFEIGAIMHFSDRLNGGIHVYNPVGGDLGKEGNEKLASAYKLGLGYDATDNFYVSAEIVKEEDKAVNVIGGIQYQFLKQFFARAGFISETGSGFAGLGLGWKNLRLDVSGSYHPQLGFSPGILLIVNFKGNKE
ncbi:MAG TPA: hypothetical protein VLR49_15345 [Ferruginibacter sp.]|nr:hypothetical protein [Ferruginibacter sp.]